MTDLYCHLLNKKNIYITKENIENILKKYNTHHTVSNIERFQLAMVHNSYLKNKSYTEKEINNIIEFDKIDNEQLAIPLQHKSYERLEYLGDSVIHLIIAEYLYKRYTIDDEGFMTKLRSKIENKEMLSFFSKKLELHNFAIISNPIESVGGRYNNINISEDIFESFVGALYLESSFKTCYKFITNIIESEIDITKLIFHETNYKDILLHYAHTMKWSDPLYILENTIEFEKDILKNTKKKFIMVVKIKNNNNILGRGEGTSKKKGEKMAAKDALKKLGLFKNIDDE